MPKQKDLKRLVRSRMHKTGESYTTARAQLTRSKTSATPPAPKSQGFAALAGMSDEAVRAKTGRTWPQWVRVLDDVDATKMSHTQIATHLHDVCHVDGWWSQSVTVGYERIRGLRERGQGRDGAYECNKSRTFAVPIATLYAAFATPRARAKWLPGVALTVRKKTANKSMRITWPDRTNLEVYFLDKGAKSTVNIQHQELASKDAAAKLKVWWHERLDALAEVLTK